MLPKTPIQDLPPLEPGIYDKMPAEEYHRHIGVSHSFIVQCQRSMAHGDAYRRVGRDATPDMAFGKAYHMLTLEPDRFAEHYVLWSGKSKAKKVENGGAMEEWKEKLESVSGDADRLLSEPDFVAMQKMAYQLRTAKSRRGLLELPGKYELTIAWNCPTTGLPCRARLDKWVPDVPMILDLKKARSAEAFAFGRQAATLGYDIEAAFYTDGAMAAMRLDDVSFAFLPQEQDDPYESALFMVGEAELNAGRRKYRPLMPIIAKCCETGVWPGYTDRVQPLSMPKWAFPPEEIESHDTDGPRPTWTDPSDEERMAANEEF